MTPLFAWITQYGYAALFGLLVLGIVGAPVPDETLLVFCGYLIYNGRLHFGWTLLAAFLGSTCGITISYFLGFRFGRKLLDRYGRYLRVTPAQIQLAEDRFNRIGPVVVSIGYFIPGLRHFTAIFAGISELPYGKFALFAYTGAAVWVWLFVTVGFVFANQWQHTSELIHRYTLIAAAVGAVLVLFVWLIRRRRLE